MYYTVSETVSLKKSSSVTDDFDKYNFFGCHLSGRDYQWERDHLDLCVPQQISHYNNSSAFLKRAQSEPNLNRLFYPGPTNSYPPPWLGRISEITLRSFSHVGILCDDEDEELIQFSLPLCPICSVSLDDHPFQHFEWDMVPDMTHVLTCCQLVKELL